MVFMFTSLKGLPHAGFATAEMQDMVNVILIKFMIVLKCDVDACLTRGNVRTEMAICYLLWNTVRFYRAKFIINKAMFSFTH